MRPRPRGFVQSLALIAAAGVAVRALYLFTLARNTKGIGDWWFYHWQAGLIADGRGFLDPFQLLEGVEAPSAGHPPLYPLLLSGLSAVGLDSTLAHRSLGLLLGAITIVLIALIAREVAGDRPALIAGGIAAAYPVLIGADGSLMSETLYGPLVAGSLLAALRLGKRPAVGTALALGALIALAALTRSEALFLLPVLALPLAWRGGPGRGLRMAAAVGAFALVLAPWAIRNAATFEHFVLISTNDSTVLAGANCPLTYDGIDMGGWTVECISPRSERDETEQAAKWRREGLEYARDHAGRLPLVAAVRLLRVWDLWQPRRQVLFAEGRHVRMAQAGVAAFFLLVPFAIAGAVGVGRRLALFVLLVPFAMVTVAAVTGYGAPRLRHAAEIPLVVLAAIGVSALLERRAREAVA